MCQKDFHHIFNFQLSISNTPATIATILNLTNDPQILDNTLQLVIYNDLQCH